jgi:DNA repair exonuclease SbcCD ATPase subunit
MKIKIRNFRGIASADIDVAGITLIAGANYQGKTSILQAIAAGMTGSPIPIAGITKSQGGLFVHSGAAGGTVDIDCAIGTSHIDYPSGKYSTTGIPPIITDDAAGLHSFLDDSPAARSSTVSAILKSDPSRELLSDELHKIGATDAGIDRVWETITKQGWDGAYAQAKEAGVRYKGAWENESGVRYGSKKAEFWRPPAWTDDLEAESEESLTTIAKQENEWLEAAISHQAVSDAELARLTDIAARIGEVSGAADSCRVTVKSIEQSIAMIRKGMAELPRPVQPESIPCPGCGIALCVQGRTIVNAQEITAEELAHRSHAIADCETDIAEAETELKSKRADLAGLDAELRFATDAKKKINAMKPPSAQTKSVDEVRARLALAQSRLIAFQKKIKAQKLCAQIAQNQAIVEILAPEGLRLQCLRSALDGFNITAKGIAAQAGWRTVEIQSDMSISYGGSLYSMLSESEQYRVRIVLQVAFATYSDSQTLIFDRADLLDGPGRNGFFRILLSTKKNCIVAMTIDKRDRCPDLSMIGGQVYWVENGIAS